MQLKLKKNNLIFYSAYFIYISSLFMEVVAIDLQILKKVFVLLSILLLCYSNLKNITLNFRIKTKISIKTIIYFLVFIFVLFLSIKTKNYYLIAIILFSISMKDLDLKEFFTVTIISLATMSIIVMIFCGLGIIPNIQTSRDTYYNSGGVRYGLGFIGSNPLPNILVYIACYYYSIKKKVGLIDFCIFQVLGIVLFALCDSRNGLIALEILCLMQLFWNFAENKKSNKLLEKISMNSFIIVALLSQILLWAYRKKMAFTFPINKMLSGRLQWVLENIWNNNPFKLFNFDTHEQFTASLLHAYDNGYYYLIARYGYIGMIIFLIVTIYAFKCLKKQNNYRAMISFIVVALLNFIDNGLISYGFLPYMLMGIYTMYHRFNKKVELITT